MGRLFWKFFLSYWAALLIAVGGTATALWLYGLTAQDPASALMAGPRAEFLVDSASATARHGGLAALRELLAQMPSDGPPPLLAVDEQGHDLLGRSVPGETLARARGLAASDGAARRARRLRLQDGSEYLLFIPADDTSLGERILHPGGRPSPLVPLSAGLLASLAFGTLLAWYVARPVRHLRSAFASLAEGRLETRVAPLIGRRRDEVADLGRDFDRMAQRLQTLIGAQRSLLHDVSHELRSPLARLQAAIGLARQSPQKLEGMLERIEREAVRVDDLVGELLTLSRLEAGAENGHLEPAQRIDLMDLVASVAADAHFEAQASGRSVVFSGEGEVVADVRAELLHRALENVVRNAVQHTGAGSSVEVRAATSPAGDAFLVTVADRGPGVPADELETVFEPFFRSANGQAGGGFGLGLAITRRAVEAHGGRVRAHNRDGGGLIVEIVVPLGGERLARP